MVTATTHLGAWQTGEADRHVIATSVDDLRSLGSDAVTLITGPIQPDQRTAPVKDKVLSRLRDQAVANGWPLLIEADGSRQKPLKAPGPSEPCIPEFVGLVILVVGMQGLGKAVNEENVHRPEFFARVSGLAMGAAVTKEALAVAITHPLGGLKGLPKAARRVVLLNQADTPELASEAQALKPLLMPHFDSVVIAALDQRIVHAAHEPCAGVVLAAGESRRFGQPKPLLDWRGEPFVRVVAKVALNPGLSPVIVVTGSNAEAVEGSIADLPIQVARNENWGEGQASSIRRGLSACPIGAASAMFLLADQPQVTSDVIRALLELHATALDPIVAPLILEERRGNPVLFDCRTFADLRLLHGDAGGREIFSKHRVRYLPWHDRGLLLDVDTPDDYQRLIDEEQ